MLFGRYDVKWVGRCQYDVSDKIWGWFYYRDPTSSPSGPIEREKWAYVFWGPTGKTLQFKRHPNDPWSMKKMVRTKIDRKYVEITPTEFDGLWTDLYDTIHNKFIFHLLANDI